MSVNENTLTTSTRPRSGPAPRRAGELAGPRHRALVIVAGALGLAAYLARHREDGFGDREWLCG